MAYANHSGTYRCASCQQQHDHASKTNCNHVFCEPCAWVLKRRVRSNCPICHQVIESFTDLPTIHSASTVRQRPPTPPAPSLHRHGAILNSILERITDSRDTIFVLPPRPVPAVETLADRPEIIFDQDECTICYSNPMVNKSIAEECGHVFCFSCLNRWSEKHTTCPMCKQTMNSFLHSWNSVNGKYTRRYFTPRRVRIYPLARRFLGRRVYES